MKTKVLSFAFISIFFCLPVMGNKVNIVTGEKALGQATFQQGTLSSNFQHAVPSVNSALENAVLALGLEEVSTAADDFGGTFVYRTEENKTITISTGYLTDSFTEIQIRTGKGKRADRDLSMTLYEKIGEML